MAVSIVNTNILKHPLNWLVIWSMILVFAFTVHLIVAWWEGRHPGVASGPTVSAGPGTSTNTVDPTAAPGS